MNKINKKKVFNEKILAGKIACKFKFLVNNTALNVWAGATKEYKEEAQCAQRGGGQILVFVICGFIKNFLPNYYFILHVHHVKSFKMRHVRSLYFNFSVRYS